METKKQNLLTPQLGQILMQLSFYGLMFMFYAF